MQRLLSKKFFTVLLATAVNVYFMVTGDIVPALVQENALMAFDALIALYVVVQGWVDRK